MEKLNRMLMSGLKWALIFLTAAVTLSVCWGVFTRYVLQSAADWTGEFSGYGLVWITFLGSAYATFKRTHIRFESLIDAIPQPWKRMIQTLFNLAMLTFVTVITIYGGKLAFSSMGDETLSLPFTKGMIYLILPIAGAILMIGYISELIRDLGSEKNSSLESEGVEQREQVMIQEGSR